MKVLIALALTIACASAFMPARMPRAPHRAPLRSSIDYNDPEVGAEFAKVQAMEFDDVEEELAMSGIPPNPMMNDMDVRLMLVEFRMRASGKLSDAPQEPKPKKTEFSSEFSRALYEKPAFERLYEKYKESSDVTATNVMAEYMNNKKK